MFALCLLGFGWSEKAVANYSGGALWADQIAAFIREVVHSGAGGSGGSGSGGSEGNGSGEVEPVVLAGNSLVRPCLSAMLCGGRGEGRGQFLL